MPGQGRVGDKGQVPIDSHGCPACPHPAVGPAIVGSPTVLCNLRPALRVGDKGVHAACCGTNTWTATKGAETVFIDGKGAHRLRDEQQHCGGKGMLIEGSSNVIVEEGGGAGGGGGGAGGGGAGAGAGGAGGAGGGAAGGSSAGGGTAGSGAGGMAGSPGTSTSSGGNGGSGSTTPGDDDGAPGAQPETPIEPDEIEIRVLSASGEPVDGARYELTMPDGTERSGFADVNGVIKLTRLEQRGDCKIVFPEIDEKIPR